VILWDDPPTRLCIPTIGTTMTLLADWTFPLHQEQRNRKFAIDHFDADWGRYPHMWRWVDDPTQRGGRRMDLNPPVMVTLPKGSVLKVERIYVRSKAKDFRAFDSVTFRVNVHLKGKAAKGKIKGRFWVKLSDANSARVEIDMDTIPYPKLEPVEEENDA
jgi:hypothetical protein